jgi:hypothetical protein
MPKHMYNIKAQPELTARVAGPDATHFCIKAMGAGVSSHGRGTRVEQIEEMEFMLHITQKFYDEFVLDGQPRYATAMGRVLQASSRGHEQHMWLVIERRDYPAWMGMCRQLEPSFYHLVRARARRPWPPKPRKRAWVRDTACQTSSDPERFAYLYPPMRLTCGWVDMSHPHKLERWLDAKREVLHGM